MTWKHELQRELSAIAAQGDLPQGATFRVDTDVGSLVGQMTAVDRLACAFMTFSLETDRLDGAELADVKNVSERLSERLTYLLEPISPIEVDQEGCTVQMRSLPPQRDENGPTYYELLVRRGELRLGRYHKTSGARQQIPAQVTREVLQRLASDFTEVVA